MAQVSKVAAEQRLLWNVSVQSPRMPFRCASLWRDIPRIRLELPDAQLPCLRFSRHAKCSGRPRHHDLVPGPWDTRAMPFKIPRQDAESAATGCRSGTIHGRQHLKHPASPQDDAGRTDPENSSWLSHSQHQRNRRVASPGPSSRTQAHPQISLTRRKTRLAPGFAFGES